MNWDLIKWVAGIMLTFAGVKFVWVFLRNLLSRDMMEDAIEAVGDGFRNLGSRTAAYAKRKAGERKAKKEAKPIVTIR